jgi:hypothetical protein
MKKVPGYFSGIFLAMLRGEGFLEQLMAFGGLLVL